MDTNRIWNLTGKKLAGEASAEELRELDALLQQGAEHTEQIPTIEEYWHSSHQQHLPVDLDNDLNSKWLQFEQKIDELTQDNDTELINVISPTPTDEVNPSNSTPKLSWLYWAAAACIGLLLSFGAYQYYIQQTDDSHTAQITAPQSGISKIVLPDGTKVWLNAGSKLTYKSHFGDQYRKVTLIGEAYFDVVKDAAHPFIVTTKSFSLKVLGTAFNVRSYPNDKTSEAALVRGRIEVSLLSSPDKKIILRPKEKLTVKNSANYNQQNHQKLTAATEETPLIKLTNTHQNVTDTLPSEALWMENKLAFDAETFDEIALKMERWYNVTIAFKNDNVKELRFTGEFKNQSLQTALTNLQATSPFHYSISNNHVTIY